MYPDLVPIIPRLTLEHYRDYGTLAALCLYTGETFNKWAVYDIGKRQPLPAHSGVRGTCGALSRMTNWGYVIRDDRVYRPNVDRIVQACTPEERYMDAYFDSL